MLRRFTLFLLTVFLALPAVAAPLCHRAAPDFAPTALAHHAGMDHSAMQADGRDRHAHDKRQAEQKSGDCIGCAARFAMPQLLAPPKLAPLAQPMMMLHRLHGIATSPALPPPRN